MAPLLYLSPTTDSALEHLLEQVRQRKAANPLAPVYILLPGGRAIQALRQRLGPGMNIHLFEFYGLSWQVIQRAAVPIHCVSDITVHRLVAGFLMEMATQGELTSFAAVWQKPGFHQVLVEWLREMKSQGIWPEEYLARSAGTNPERDRQLGTLYGRYQSYLQQHNLSDPDGLMWLTAEALEARPGLFRSPGRLIVFGFDQFNPMQIRLLQHLAGRFQETALYLTWDPRRPADSLALARLKNTRAQLEKDITFSTESLAEATPDGLPSALASLRAGLFEPVERIEPAEGLAVQLIAAPSREEEVRQALRQVKRLLLAGVSPDEIAVLAAVPAVYDRLAATIAEEYGLPLLLGERLALQPVIAALRNVLLLFPRFPWRGVLDALRSPYIHQNWLTPDQVNLLDQLSREQPVIEGRDQWRFALRPLAVESSYAADDEELGSPSLRRQLPPETLAAIEAGLGAFFDHLTPAPRATYREYVLWIQEGILGLAGPPDEDGEPVAGRPPSLEMTACCETGERAPVERAALALALQALAGLVEAADLAPGPEDGRVPWADFVAEALSILPGIEIRPDPYRSGVHFGALESGRSVGVDHLFVLGLAEGEFPRPPAPDPLYTRSERLSHRLPVRRDLPGEDASLWWQMLANARRTLTLLRPYLDENGAPWLASPYWTAVREALSWGEAAERRIPISARIPVGDAASRAEFLTALALSGANEAPVGFETLWGRAARARAVLRLREGWGPLTAFEGRFASPGLQAELASRFGEGYVWSASRLNRYGDCPYKFFAQAVLRLEERRDPAEGLDAMQRGSLLHAVLEALYQKLALDEITLNPAAQEQALALLDGCCEDIFRRAPARHGFRPGPLWQYEQAELRRLLYAFVEWECGDKQAASGYLPYRQELRFGIQGGEYGAVRLEGSQGEAIWFHGVIDRIDRDADGRLRVIDYKSGSDRKFSSDIKDGLAFQVPLYALAAELALGAPAAESYYLHLPAREPSARLPFSQGAAQDATVQEAVEKALEFASQIRSGDFLVLPARPGSGANACTRRCPYGSLCRTDRHSRQKARHSHPEVSYDAE